MIALFLLAYFDLIAAGILIPVAIDITLRGDWTTR